MAATSASRATRYRESPHGARAASSRRLQPTALVHEAYLRVAGAGQNARWDRRGHFFAAAALAMRRILVERARHHQRLKHGAGGERVDLDSAIAGADPGLTDLVAIDEALTRLEQTDARKAQESSRCAILPASASRKRPTPSISPPRRSRTSGSSPERGSYRALDPAGRRAGRIVTPEASQAESIFLALADLESDGPRGAARRPLRSRRCGCAPKSTPCWRQSTSPTTSSIPSRCRRSIPPASTGRSSPERGFGDYLVLHALGSGGMGVVYAAQQDCPHRTVAIKVLHRGARRREIAKRFELEAELLGRLQHPGIAQVYAFNAGDRVTPAYLVMELVPGPPITEFAQAHALPYMARVALGARVCEAHSPCARTRDRSSRPEAGERADVRRRPAEDSGFRDRACRRPGSAALHDSDPARRAGRHAAVHEPRAAARPARPRRPQRCVQRGRPDLSPALRTSAHRPGPGAVCRGVAPSARGRAGAARPD